MKILIVHPSDSVDAGPWARDHWDWIVDLGWSGRFCYEQASRTGGCRVFSLHDHMDPDDHRSGLRSSLSAGLGKLVDEEGLDWWDLFVPLAYSRIDEILMVWSLRRKIPEGAEVVATRPHSCVRILSAALGRGIHCYAEEKTGGDASRLRRYSELTKNFRPAQLLEFALDKWDTDFRLRRFLHQKEKSSAEPAVLLPSAYVNVSRTQVAYAQRLPEHRFLQVVTRPNGRLDSYPQNVSLRSLAAYSPIPNRKSTETEWIRLSREWQHVEEKTLDDTPELKLAKEFEAFSGFPRFLRTGLRLRDAWVGVLQQEPIASVLAADENNAYTRMPVVLARRRGIRTVLCDHGALNMTVAYRPLQADLYLAGGEMARDYLVRFCGVSGERVVVGAAQEALSTSVNRDRNRDWIVLFSEAYELFAGRTEMFYREVIPHLCALAREVGRKVVVKLHPFESADERRRMLGRLLSSEDLQAVEVRQDALTDEFMGRVWCGLTVESTVACECALRRIPAFLCSWFESSWYQYGPQFARFGAAQVLQSPEQIKEIPRRVAEFVNTPEKLERIKRTIDREDLQRALTGASAHRATAATLGAEQGIPVR